MVNLLRFSSTVFHRPLVCLICIYAFSNTLLVAGAKKKEELKKYFKDGASCDSSEPCPPWHFGDYSFSVACTNKKCTCESGTIVVSLGGIHRCFSLGGTPCRIFNPAKTESFSPSELNYFSIVTIDNDRLCASRSCENNNICTTYGNDWPFEKEIAAPTTMKPNETSVGCPSIRIPFTSMIGPFLAGFGLTFLISSCIL